MIVENSGLNGLKSDLAYLDESAEKVGFVRWQWEYYRATYDYKIEHNNDEYYLRINTRAVEGNWSVRTRSWLLKRSTWGGPLSRTGWNTNRKFPRR